MEFEFGSFYQIPLNFLIELSLFATKNLFYSPKYYIGAAFSFFTLFWFVLVIFFNFFYLLFSKEKKFEFLETIELKENLKNHKTLKFLGLAFLTSDFIKSVSIVLLRGRREWQVAFLSISNFLPVLFWLSSFKIYILKSKFDSVVKLIQEILITASFLCTLFKFPILLVLLIFQILLLIVNFFYYSYFYLKVLIFQKSKKSSAEKIPEAVVPRRIKPNQTPRVCYSVIVPKDSRKLNRKIQDMNLPKNDLKEENIGEESLKVERRNKVLKNIVSIRKEISMSVYRRRTPSNINNKKRWIGKNLDQKIQKRKNKRKFSRRPYRIRNAYFVQKAVKEDEEF